MHSGVGMKDALGPPLSMLEAECPWCLGGKLSNGTFCDERDNAVQHSSHEAPSLRHFKFESRDRGIKVLVLFHFRRQHEGGGCWAGQL